MLETTVEWGSADLLLVTDGELQNPPIETDLIDKLRRLEREKGLEVHGLLVGRRSSKPLEMLCTGHDGVHRVHDFLSKYDYLTNLAMQSREPETSSPIEVINNKGVFRLYSGSIMYRSKIHRRRNNYHSRFSFSMNMQFDNTDMFWEGDRGDLGDKVVVLIATTKEEVLGRETTTVVNSELMDNYKSSSVMSTKSVIQHAMGVMQEGLIERNEEVQLLLLAALSREHLLLLGPPGTGKSELGRRLSSIAGDGLYFERLLTRYSTPEELFGPLSLSALENDQYIRNIRGYLPTASVAFLDEIFKANSAILNSLLTILNERKFDNGNVRIPVPLLAVVGASNELPGSDDLNALFDRFLFRKKVSPVTDTGIYSLMQLCYQNDILENYNTNMTTSLIDHNFTEIIISKSKLVIIPSEVLNLIKGLKMFLRDQYSQPIYISDRRLVKSLKVLQISALTNGRSTVSLIDCFLLKHIFWNCPEDQLPIEKWLLSHLPPLVDEKGLKFLINEEVARINRQVEHITGTYLHGLIEDVSLLSEIIRNKSSMMSQLVSDIQTATVFGDNHLWLSRADLFTLKETVLKSSITSKSSLDDLLIYVTSIINILRDETISDKRAMLQELFDYFNQNNNLDVVDSGSDVGVDVTMSKKDAQRLLSPEKYKIWKKSQKSLKRKEKEVDDD